MEAAASLVKAANQSEASLTPPPSSFSPPPSATGSIPTSPFPAVAAAASSSLLSADLLADIVHQLWHHSSQPALDRVAQLTAVATHLGNNFETKAGVWPSKQKHGHQHNDNYQEPEDHSSADAQKNDWLAHMWTPVAPSLRLPMSEKGGESYSFQLDEFDPENPSSSHDSQVVPFDPDHADGSLPSWPNHHKRAGVFAVRRRQLATITYMLHESLNAIVDVAMAIELQRTSPLLFSTMVLQTSPLLEAFSHKPKSVQILRLALSWMEKHRAEGSKHSVSERDMICDLGVCVK
jgi:hypothetical protein